MCYNFTFYALCVNIDAITLTQLLLKLEATYRIPIAAKGKFIGTECIFCCSNLNYCKLAPPQEFLLG